jgi:hypothetical protein
VGGLYDTRLRRANRCAERALDLAEAEMRGLRFSDFMVGPEFDRVERSMVRVLETGGEPQYVEIHVQVAGESRGHAWSVFLSPLRDEDGAVLLGKDAELHGDEKQGGHFVCRSGRDHGVRIARPRIRPLPRSSRASWKRSRGYFAVCRRTRPCAARTISSHRSL